ncbi:MAG: lipocalin-like domain-containing protein [Alcaligenaceae bacterium]
MIATVARILAAVLCLSISPVALSEPTPAHPLVGTWRLISIVKVDPKTGERSEPWGKNPKGLITYMLDGRMSAIVSHEVFPALKSDATAEDLAQENRRAFSYAGTYKVEGGVVFHTIEVSDKGYYLGTVQRRPFTITGKQVSLFSAATGQTLSWTKVE